MASLVVTVFCAASVLVRWRREADDPISWAEAVLWQGLIYGSWAPYAVASYLLLGRMGLTLRSGLVLYGLALAGGAAHSLLALALDASFARRDLALGALDTRLPIDLLIATAISAVAAAAQASRRNSELEAALARARTASSGGTRSAHDRLLVTVGRGRAAIQVNEVEWFGAAGNYVVVNWAGREGLVRGTLQNLAASLDPAVFARSHRSAIVNLSKVRHAASLSDGSWRLTLESGAELVASRTYRDQILSALGRR